MNSGSKIANCKIKEELEQVVIQLDGFPAIVFQFPDQQAPTLQTYDFAMWAILPIALRLGLTVRFHQPMSKKGLDSANNIAKVWQRWLPNFFSDVKLEASTTDPHKDLSAKALTFFSGGIDSTYSAHKIYNEHGRDSDSLTIHGMDYKFDDDSRFESLKEQTQTFRESIFGQSHFVKTNLYNVYSLIGCNPKGSHVTHIFAMFSCGSLFETYATYRIAADYRLDQQLEVHPWGSNTATNRLMRSGNGQLVTLDDDITRAEKANYLANSGLDLSSLSICVDHNIRPHNCGVCSKCIRTKAMFYATTGNIPTIFLDRDLSQNWHDSIHLKRKNERVFLSDIIETAIANGCYESFPGMKEAHLKLRAEQVKAARNPMYGTKPKQLFKELLPLRWRITFKRFQVRRGLADTL